MPDRQVRVRCAVCHGAGNGFLTTGQWSNNCAACGGEGKVQAVLTDPDAEALMADGEKLRAILRHPDGTLKFVPGDSPAPPAGGDRAR